MTLRAQGLTEGLAAAQRQVLAQSEWARGEGDLSGGRLESWGVNKD